MQDIYKGSFMHNFNNGRFSLSSTECRKNLTWRIYKRRPIPVAFCLSLLAFYFVLRIYRLPVELNTYYELLASSTGAHKCRLPVLDPYDPSILKYIEKPTAIVCKKIQPMLTFLDSTTSELVLNETAVKAEGMGMAQVLCQHRCFYHNSGVGDDEPKYDEWKEMMGNRVKVKCEFVEVSCSKRTLLKIPLHSYHHAQIIPADKKTLGVEKTAGSDKLNVFIFGIDSMSDSNFRRQLPLTLNFLENQLGAITMKSHSKVGDNTWINSIAMLTGKLVQSTKEFETELGVEYDRFYDDYAEFIWKNFTADGYATMFAEDRPDINNFNYAPKKGFKYMPTTHYMRPYWYALWWSFLHSRSSAYCYNLLTEHDIMLDWAKQFVEKYNKLKIPHFGWYWTQHLSHDSLNKIGAADTDFLQFFKDVQPFLDNTVLLVLSDHGNRYDSIRESIIGRLETRMPFLSVILPKSFREQNPTIVKNLRSNSKRLTSMFDIYATLVDILGNSFTDMSKQPSTKGPGLSLFRPIPDDRYCYVAKIPEEYCPCYSETEVPTDSPKSIQIAGILVDHVNSRLKTYQPSVCAVLKLGSIKDTFVFFPTQKMLKDPQVGDSLASSGFYLSYRIQIVVEPSGALLEGVVKHFLDGNTFAVDGDVDRNNKYGNTSACVTEAVLKKFCFCL